MVRSCLRDDDDVSMEVAIGGSCTRPPMRDFQRAGWSIAVLDPRSSTPPCCIHAPVPASPPQSSVMGEHLGAAFVSQIAGRPCQVLADTMG
eukprot:9467980-Pyramimonas_sp.AAC.1